MPPDHASPPTVPVVVSDAHRAHDPAYELNAGRRVAPRHERPQRVEAIRAHLAGLGHPLVPAGEHGEEPLRAVHDPGLIGFLRDGHAAWRAAGGPEVMVPDTFRSPRWAHGGRPTAAALGRPGWWCFDTATPIVEGSYAAARAAVDVALTGVGLLRSGTRTVYGLTRPPGHHAGPDYIGGFCLLNHAAIAARQLAADGRVAVLDLDVHHGNGTQDVFLADPQVLYVSAHGDPDHLFPFFSGFAQDVGVGAGRGTTRNLPLAPGAGDTAWLAAVSLACELVADFEPTSVVVSLGLDAYIHDPVGSLAVSRAGLGAMATLVASLNRPTLLVQEGGYALEELGTLASRVLRAFEPTVPSATARIP